MWRWLWQKVRDDYDWVFIIFDEVFLLLNLTFDNSWFFSLSVFLAYEMLACGMRDWDKTEEFMLILILICFLSLPLSLILICMIGWLSRLSGFTAFLYLTPWEQARGKRGGISRFGPLFFPQSFCFLFSEQTSIIVI